MSSSVFTLFVRRIANAWEGCLAAFPRSEHEGTILPISSSPSSITITKTRSLTMGSVIQNHDDAYSFCCYPLLYANATEIERLEYHQQQLPMSRSPFTPLSKTIVNLSFQAALAMYAQQDQQLFLGALMVTAFAASTTVIFINRSYPTVAALVDKIAYLTFSIGFFVMTSGFFSRSSFIYWIIACLTCALPMLAFLLGCLA
ncbi:hypothetical protein RIF29_21408 [Crotalaria pallida]|uniref:Uncharacterized protein n=1 Tax=Crotalaria pallida TaxID=3830 RepID=A0AAN9I764_CROPI